jgi:hypothetical protein
MVTMTEMRFYARLTRQVLVAVVILSALVAGSASAEAAKVDPQATGLLKDATTYLGDQLQFSVDTRNTIEDLLPSGQRLDIEVVTSIVVRRPNKLRAMRNDHAKQAFYYDGEDLTLHNPTDKVYATVPAPDTLAATLDFTRESLGFMIPATDLIYPGSFPLLMQFVTSASVIGKAMIDGVSCDHLAFSKPGVDFQIWIADNGKPLVHKYVVTDTAGPERLSVSTVMSNWEFGSAVVDAGFSFTEPPGDNAIEFIRLDSVSTN